MGIEENKNINTLKGSELIRDNVIETIEKLKCKITDLEEENKNKDIIIEGSKITRDNINEIVEELRDEINTLKKEKNDKDIIIEQKNNHLIDKEQYIEELKEKLKKSEENIQKFFELVGNKGKNIDQK